MKTLSLIMTMTLSTGAVGCLDRAEASDDPPAPEPESGSASLGAPDEPGWFADIRAPTADGRASYWFRFGEVDGVLVTSVESPLGYPQAVVPDECALQTYLRVADADAIVPEALLRGCGSDAAPGVARVSDLRTPDLQLELTAAAAPLCSHAAFDDRIDQLQDLAAYQPPIPDCDSVCDVYVFWNQSGCAFYDENGSFIGICAPQDLPDIMEEFPFGEGCVDSHLECNGTMPNPACAHDETVLADWGPWLTWERSSGSGSVTTRTRVELSACDASGIEAWWRGKENGGDPWGSKHFLSYPGNTRSVLTLSAGWDGADKWRGWDFDVGAAGSGFHVGYARVELQGKNRFTCPLGI